MAHTDPKAAFDLPPFLPGWVWLAGAGPGDPGLLTLMAAKALGEADAILYDALVDPRVLKLARADARRHYVGKRGGIPSLRQEQITHQLATLARSGLRVLRLKGGDPFVFGRGAEEAEGLITAGIPVRIVPGVSAGIGGLAAAGIPLTHRDINQAVTFVTGHDALGELPSSLDWKALSQSSPVIVVYMGMKHRREIARHLITSGRKPDELVAIIANATSAYQQVVETDLRALMMGLEPAVDGPAMIVVGEVVALRRWLAPPESRQEHTAREVKSLA